MGLSWVLFNLTGTLVDPTVLAQPLGDSGAAEDLVLSALDDTVAMAMVDAVTGDSHTLNELMAAAMRRRLRLVGADADRADAALALVSTMPAYIEAPGALESLRARGLKLGVLSQSSADATDSVLRFAGLRTGWVARRERSLLDTVPTPDYTGRDLAEVAEAIVTRMS
jgi:FMN phosphatase YigB (HAD superfamily)